MEDFNTVHGRLFAHGTTFCVDSNSGFRAHPQFRSDPVKLSFLERDVTTKSFTSRTRHPTKILYPGGHLSLPVKGAGNVDSHDH